MKIESLPDPIISDWEVTQTVRVDGTTYVDVEETFTTESPVDTALVNSGRGFHKGGMCLLLLGVNGSLDGEGAQVYLCDDDDWDLYLEINLKHYEKREGAVYAMAYADSLIAREIVS